MWLAALPFFCKSDSREPCSPARLNKRVAQETVEFDLMSHRATLLGAAASLALLGSVAPASATHFNGWYLGVEGGASWVEDNKYDFGTSTNTPVPLTRVNRAAQYDTGWAVLATVGYGFGMHVR